MGHPTRCSLLAGAISLVMLGIFAAPAHGQLLGDANNDGRIDHLDFLAMDQNQCLQGPAILPPRPYCGPFDNPRWQRPSTLTPITIAPRNGVRAAGCDSVSHHVGFDYIPRPEACCVPVPNGTSVVGGVWGLISTNAAPLCGGSTRQATVAWVGVQEVENRQLLRWAQAGYARQRNFPTTGPTGVPPPNPGLSFRRYLEIADDAETQANNFVNYVRIFGPEPCGVVNYSLYLTNQTTGQWVFDIWDSVCDDVTIYVTSPPWAGHLATRVQCMSESKNSADYTVGTPTTPCQFEVFWADLSNQIWVLLDFCSDPASQGLGLPFVDVMNSRPAFATVRPACTAPGQSLGNVFELWDLRP